MKTGRKDVVTTDYESTVITYREEVTTIDHKGVAVKTGRKGLTNIIQNTFNCDK
jgi:hypothetical protein